MRIVTTKTTAALMLAGLLCVGGCREPRAPEYVDETGAPSVADPDPARIYTTPLIPPPEDRDGILEVAPPPDTEEVMPILPPDRSPEDFDDAPGSPPEP
jgi:hypothetical protein